MSETTAVGRDGSPEEVGAVLGRLLEDFAATAGTFLTALGLRVGLWDALAEGPAPARIVAGRAGIAIPYALEWLRSQAAAGYVDHDVATDTFALAPGVAAVVGSGPMAGLTAGGVAQLRVYWAELDRYDEAFRSGQGISWADLPAAHAEGMDLITRAVIAPSLVADWLPALEGVVARLSAGAAAADIGCGYGAPTIAMAEAFPASTFAGFDADDASVAQARKAAAAAGVSDRVSFEVATAADVSGGPYDLVVFIDALHDFADPVLVLTRVRQLLAPDGVVLLVEHAGSERLEENLNPVGRFFYAASALVCTPNALAEKPAASPLGSIPGEPALRQVATEAGFARVRRVDVDAPLNLLLELRS